MVFKNRKRRYKEREKVLKQTRMERHEEKLKGLSKRNRRLVTFTTLVGLICPATLGTIQALADETAPTTEQTAEPVTEPVTPEQPIAETPSQELVTPVPVETTPIQPETPTVESVSEVQPTAPEEETQNILEQPETEITPQADLSAELAEWNNYFTLIVPLLDELESKVAGTSYQARYDGLYNRFDFVSFTGGQFPESTRTQAFYDQWLPELASILADLQQLKAEITPPVQTGVFYDLVGDTSAKVGETKTYTYNEVKFFSDGTMTETPVNIEDTSFPLTSSDPSDVIVGGSITFGSEGTRTLVAKDNAGASLTVTVTKEDVTPPVPVDIELNVIGETSAKTGESKTYQLEKTEYFSDGTKKITILDFPNEYGALISSEPTDVISNGTITFTKAGTRTLKSESYGEATFVVAVTESSVTPPKDVDKSGLEEAIKKGEQAIKDGNWKDDSKLVTAIEDGKKILNDDKATQAQVDEATKNINDAIDALEKADNNGGNGNNGKGNGGNNGNDNNQNGNNNGSNSNNGTGNNNQNTNTNQNKTNNSNNQSNKNNTSNKDNLPLTGDTTTNGLLAGLSMVGLSAIALLKRKRKA